MRASAEIQPIRGLFENRVVNDPRADYTRRLLAAAFTGKLERVKGIEPSS